ncbi:pentatricopeptide repeat-containing protein [Tripterygium wilfordii]|uniref:Pentatricopeptide repeat-containing protein n=2 Tax=Tripterygium wilfordii TaxID=458696 RepID=A0A7J7CN95_TRIWF|nr:pentatricopeptide repeat-containing protein [Tripterygium wilfordii]
MDKDFKHLTPSCEVMASMLVHVGMLREVELLLLGMENQGITFHSAVTFGNLVGGYLGRGETGRAFFVYNQMRGQGLIPPLSCCSALLHHLVRIRETQLAFRVCLDMVEIGINASDLGKSSVDNIVRLLCSEGMIQEARNLVKKAMALGFEPSSLVIYEIACGYCENKDFEDLLGFFVQMKCPPDVLTGNSIINTICSYFGAERADFFRQKLEQLGFQPNEITFGVLIGWSCHVGNLRNAVTYWSETLSRGLKPHICSYNSLISGMFMQGMWEHVQAVLDEMVDRGTTPNLTTFRILLAGYCKARRFDEAKNMIPEMVNRGFIESSSPEDPLSKVFTVLGLNPSAVRLKRDNDVGFLKTEFFDTLGNGLYLDTDLDEYEKRVNDVLQESTIIDYNSVVMKECSDGNYSAAVGLVNEMVQWGQGLSLSVFSALLNGLCTSRLHVRASAYLLDQVPKLTNQLDQETLNLLVQAYCKKGLTYKGSILFDGMQQRNLTIHGKTFSLLIKGLCKMKNNQKIIDLLAMAQQSKWLPELEDCKALVECLCHQNMLKEVLKLFESMMVANTHLRLEICHVFLEKLCVLGFAGISHVLVEKLLLQGFALDHIAYSHLLRGFCKEKRFSVAFTILDSMLTNNLVPCLDVSVILIPQLCRAARFEKAIALKNIVSAEQSKLSSSVNSALVKGYFLTRKIEEAVNLVQDMMWGGQVPDAEIYDIMFQENCRVKNFTKVRELVGAKIRNNLGLPISSYRNWVRLMCADGRFLSALRLKDFMLGQSGSHGLIVYNILLFYLLSNGNLVLVTELLNELQKKGLLLDEVSYNFLVYGFSQCKEVSTSVHYLSTMISKGLRPSNRSLRTVLCSLCELGVLKEALELSREMHARDWIHGSLVQNSLVECLVSHGQLQEAEDFLDRMVRKGQIHDSINYNYLIRLFCQYGRLNKVVDLLNVMLKKGNIPNSASYDSIIQSFCACNKMDQAMTFQTEMLDRDLKPSIKTWNMLVHKFCQDGQSAEAERLLISMVQLGVTPTREIYYSLINCHRYENNLRKASELVQVMQRNGYEPDFDMHWSLISKLSHSNDKDKDSSSKGFLSRLLSGSGFTSKSKLG